MKARKLKLGINMDNGWMYSAYRKRGQGPIALRVISLEGIFFFHFIMYFAYYILYLWTFFKETYVLLALQVKEGVVAQKEPTAHISWSYIPWSVFQLMYFAITEKFS